MSSTRILYFSFGVTLFVILSFCQFRLITQSAHVIKDTANNLIIDGEYENMFFCIKKNKVSYRGSFTGITDSALLADYIKYYTIWRQTQTYLGYLIATGLYGTMIT